MKGKITLLHICNFAAPYKGSFMESLLYLDEYPNVKNIYLFPYRALSTNAKSWIAELKEQGTVVYIQENNLLKNFILLKRIIKEHKVNFVFRHFHDLLMDVFLKVAFSEKRVIRFFHCTYDENSSVGLKHKIRNFLWRNNILIGISKFISSDLKNIFPKSSIYTIENAIPFERLNKIDEFKRAEKISLMIMGYNIKVKGIDLAMKTVQRLRQKYDVVLNIVAASHRDELISYIKSEFREIPQWINILPPTPNVATYYMNNDIFLSPSREEAFGYASIEAAYCKRSIVLSKVGGQGQLEIDGAYWFESENLDEFYEKLELAIQELDSPEKQAQKEATCKAVQEKYSLDRWRDEVLGLIK